ncbi:hypothetical protein HID58_045940 [Brassica napus]|uniref:Uncharacterized protein n=1 Tax=Brassica napus TaxID=3708 RepID=A0ABQ8AV11_BRANA|nr:hypothetical protein HID58_045940 [Brassica napus]
MMNTTPTVNFLSSPSRSDMCFSLAAEALIAPPAAMPPALCSSPSCSTTPIIIFNSSPANLLLNDSKLSSSTIETMN